MELSGRQLVLEEDPSEGAVRPAVVRTDGVEDMRQSEGPQDLAQREAR